jgi:NifU-like protein involved in Fe-S cluster formation
MNNINYDKKVIKRFLKPKFAGDIKNPDAIGQVGNAACLLPEEKIWINGMLKPIIESKKNDKVLSHEAKEDNILQTFDRNYTGDIKILKNCLGSIGVTPEHLIYAVKVPKTNKYLRNKSKRELIASWHHAGNLEKRDIVLYPILKNEKDAKFIEVNIPKLKFDYRSKEIPNKIPLNEELLRLFGYFLAEGHISEKITHVNISFALHINEKDIAEDIKKITKKIFNLEVNITERPEEHGLKVTINSVKIARLFKGLFGNGAKNKKIPEILMSLPIEKQKALIYGFWKGDGYINLNRIGPRAGYSTISYNLAQQIKILLLRQKIVPSYYVEKEKIVRGVKHQESYRIHVGQRESLIKLSRILNKNYNPKSYGVIDSWFDENYLYTPITQIKKLDYSGKVHNLEVENTHSFLTDAFTVHNCGDIMKVFLKIDKDKKGKEKIKDIKFKTMGCVAAIASSDAVCELAKGKSLEEAKKINKKDILKKVGKLPTIKHHCSILGEEALLEAIKDYEKKGNNNL